jgi:hypothetical protein
VPSGLQVPFVTSSLYDTVLPVVGHLESKSVATLYPFDQQDLVPGPFVHAESATLEVVEVAWLVDVARFTLCIFP